VGSSSDRSRVRQDVGKQYCLDILDEAVKSLYSVSFCELRVDSIAVAGGTPALPGLFAASSFLMKPQIVTF